MADASWPLQQALFDKLTAALSPVLVYDDVPQDAAFPYARVGDETAVDFGTKTKPGQEFTVTVHVWSRYRGAKEAKEILGQIYDALHEQPLTVAGFDVAFVRFDFAGPVMLEPDGITRHGVSRFRIITTPA